MTPREALERARATVKHAITAEPEIPCAILDGFWDAVEERCSNDVTHELVASALLDGLSVSAVTRAERELDR